MKYFQDFYKKLFKNTDSSLNKLDFNSINLNSNISKLSVNESNRLEGPLTIEEIGIYLRKMKNGKCPGIDGFPSEFFRVFWSKLKSFVWRSLNEVYEDGEMCY